MPEREIEIVEEEKDVVTEHREEFEQEGSKEILKRYEVTIENGREILKKLIKQVETRNYEIEGKQIIDTKIKELHHDGKLKTRIIQKDVEQKINNDKYRKETNIVKLMEKGKKKEIHREEHIHHENGVEKKVIRKTSNDLEHINSEVIIEYIDGEVAHKKATQDGKLLAAIGKFEPMIIINEGDDKISFRFNRIVDGKGKGKIVASGNSKNHIIKNVHENIEEFKKMLQKEGVEIHEDSDIVGDGDEELVLGTLKYLLHHMIFDIDLFRRIEVSEDEAELFSGEYEQENEIEEEITYVR